MNIDEAIKETELDVEAWPTNGSCRQRLAAARDRLMQRKGKNAQQ